jgi:hypothetical protein
MTRWDRCLINYKVSSSSSTLYLFIYLSHLYIFSVSHDSLNTHGPWLNTIHDLFLTQLLPNLNFNTNKPFEHQYTREAPYFIRTLPKHSRNVSSNLTQLNRNFTPATFVEVFESCILYKDEKPVWKKYLKSKKGSQLIDLAGNYRKICRHRFSFLSYCIFFLLCFYKGHIHLLRFLVFLVTKMDFPVGMKVEGRDESTSTVDSSRKRRRGEGSQNQNIKLFRRPCLIIISTDPEEIAAAEAVLVNTSPHLKVQEVIDRLVLETASF